jgi:hypothetical protein
MKTSIVVLFLIIVGPIANAEVYTEEDLVAEWQSNSQQLSDKDTNRPVDAASAFCYSPRFVDGDAVPTPNVKTRITFKLSE